MFFRSFPGAAAHRWLRWAGSCRSWWVLAHQCLVKAHAQGLQPLRCVCRQPTPLHVLPPRQLPLRLTPARSSAGVSAHRSCPLPAAARARRAAGLAAALGLAGHEAVQESRGPDDALGVSPPEPLVRPHAFAISGGGGSSVAGHTHVIPAAAGPRCSRLPGLSPCPAALLGPSCPWCPAQGRVSMLVPVARSAPAFVGSAVLAMFLPLLLSAWVPLSTVTWPCVVAATPTHALPLRGPCWMQCPEHTGSTRRGSGPQGTTGAFRADARAELPTRGG